MVLVERNVESIRNGRRSRGPSPNNNNGHGTPVDTSSDEDSTKKTSSKTKAKSEYEEKIRVGRDYQAVCPDLIPVSERKPEMLNDRALLVWSPTKDIPDDKLEEYISVAKEKYGYNGEQALGMLFWHKHDLERAVLDLANFTPFPDEWSTEDKVLFEQAFQFHGKSFHRIRQMLPDKSIASLVKYYYSWKKTRSRNSVIDRQEKIKIKDGSDNGSDNGSNDDSDSEDKKWRYHRGIRRASGSPPRSSIDEQTNSTSTPTNQAHFSNNDSKIVSTTTENNSPSSSTRNCNGCGVNCTFTNTSALGQLCGSCFHHWRRTGELRPTSGPCYYNRRTRGGTLDAHKRKPPRGIYINHDDIVAFAQQETHKPNRNDCLLATMDRELSTLLSHVQNNKQIISTLKRKHSVLLDEVKPPMDTSNRITSRWKDDELLLAAQGIRKFGKNFQDIAEILGTKTEAQVRAYFVNYRRRDNLDILLKEYETINEDHSNNKHESNMNKTSSETPTTIEGDLGDEELTNADESDEIEEISPEKNEKQDLVINNKLDTNMKNVSISAVSTSSSTTSSINNALVTSANITNNITAAVNTIIEQFMDNNTSTN